MQSVPWEHFGPLVKRKGEVGFRFVEKRRFEEYSVPPGPDNDVIAGSALVVWSPSLISVFKSVEHLNHLVATSAKALYHLFDTLWADLAVSLTVETGKVFQGLRGCLFILEQKHNIDQMCHLGQWRKFTRTWIRQGTRGEFRQFDEERDEAFIKMRMLAIRDA
jgi:hypothetical protein